MMSVYLAGRYGRRAELARYAAELRDAGIEVVSTWHDRPGRLTEAEADTADTYERRALAELDLHELRSATLTVVFTEADGHDRTGHQVEYGYALGEGLEVLVVGPVRNIFNELAGLRCDTWPEAMRYLMAYRGALWANDQPARAGREESPINLS